MHYWHPLLNARFRLLSYRILADFLMGFPLNYVFASIHVMRRRRDWKILDSRLYLEINRKFELMCLGQVAGLVISTYNIVMVDVHYRPLVTGM